MSGRKSGENDKRQMCKSEMKLDEDGKKRDSPTADGQQMERMKKGLIDRSLRALSLRVVMILTMD